MIDAIYYHNLYLAIVILLTIIYSITYDNYQNTRISSNISTNSLWGWGLSVLFAIFIGFRPISGIFIDTMNYAISYDYIINSGDSFQIDTEVENLIFDNLLSFLAINNFDISIFFFIIAIIYFVGTFIALKKFFPKDSVYAFVIFLAAFSTFSYGTNGIKAGAAAAIFLCALAYREKKILSIFLLLISLGFHHSMTLPIAAYVCANLIKNNKFYIALWVFGLFCSILHITIFQTLFASFTDEKGASYLEETIESWGGQTGFRWDFILYSLGPMIVGYYAIYKNNLSDKTYTFLLHVYIFTNAIWLLCMYAAFTNRIAYLSWLLYPVVLVYPFFTKEYIPFQYKALNFVVWFQLLFTLGMTYIYYA